MNWIIGGNFYVVCFDPVCALSVCLSVSGGIPSMVSQSVCCQATAGSGVMSQVCNTNPWTASDFPPAAGSGRATGTWMKTLRASPQRKG